MGGMGTTVKERILLHLLSYARKVGAPPVDVTQKGIAKAVGIRRSHAPRALKQLVSGGEVLEARDRVAGGREMKVYALSERGLVQAEALAERVAALPVTVVHGESRRELTLGEAMEAYSLRLVDALREVHGGVLTIAPGGAPTEVRDFVDREEELGRLRAWYRKGPPILVLYGGAGYGKTALARRFLQSEGVRNPLWVDLEPGDAPGAVLEALQVRGADATDPEAAARAAVASPRAPLVVFDGYGDLGEPLADFFSALVDAAAGERTKFLVLALDTTPSYSRFYGRAAVQRGQVEELQLGGLDEAASKVLLRAPDIDDEAFKRIYLLTRGCPLYLKLIRDEDAQELKRRSRFTTPEIRLLIFSKDVRQEAP